MNIKISVVVPIYKVEKFIHECADSILSQTYHNIQIIFVDDGSPDNCGTILDQYAEKDERIRVIHKTNGGVSAARNDGLQICTGDYIYIMDSDDYLERNTLSLLMQELEEHPEYDILEYPVLVQVGKRIRKIHGDSRPHKLIYHSPCRQIRSEKDSHAFKAFSLFMFFQNTF